MKITLQLEGLHCGHCVQSVSNALQALGTVEKVEIDLAQQIAVIETEERPEILIETIENLGFEAKLSELH